MMWRAIWTFIFILGFGGAGVIFIIIALVSLFSEPIW